MCTGLVPTLECLVQYSTSTCPPGTVALLLAEGAIHLLPFLLLFSFIHPTLQFGILQAECGEGEKREKAWSQM